MNICIFFNFLEEEEQYECRIKLINKYPINYVRNILEDSISSYIDAVSYQDNEQLLRENLLACNIIESFEIIPIAKIDI